MTLRPSRIIGLFGVLASAGCASPLAHTHWSPTTIGGETEKTYMSLHFSGGHFRGHGACNSFTGKYSYDDGAFVVSDIAMTEKACASELMAGDERFIATLRAARHLTVASGVLVLRDQAGLPLAEFATAFPDEEVIIVG